MRRFYWWSRACRQQEKLFIVVSRAQAQFYICSVLRISWLFDSSCWHTDAMHDCLVLWHFWVRCSMPLSFSYYNPYRRKIWMTGISRICVRRWNIEFVRASYGNQVSRWRRGGGGGGILCSVEEQGFILLTVVQVEWSQIVVGQAPHSPPPPDDVVEI